MPTAGCGGLLQNPLLLDEQTMLEYRRTDVNPFGFNSFVVLNSWMRCVDFPKVAQKDSIISFNLASHSLIFSETGNLVKRCLSIGLSRSPAASPSKNLIKVDKSPDSIWRKKTRIRARLPINVVDPLHVSE